MRISITLKIIMEANSELEGMGKLDDLFNSYIVKEIVKDVQIEEVDRVEEPPPTQPNIELPNLRSLETVKEDKMTNL